MECLSYKTRKVAIVTAVYPHVPPALATPSVNRGVGFTREQRRKLGLTGRLPSGVLTLEQQGQRVWQQLQRLGTDLDRNLLLDQVRNRHEGLDFKGVSGYRTD